LILPWKGLFFVRHNLTIAQFEWITRSLLGIHRGLEIEWMVMTARKICFWWRLSWFSWCFIVSPPYLCSFAVERLRSASLLAGHNFFFLFFILRNSVFLQQRNNLGGCLLKTKRDSVPSFRSLVFLFLLFCYATKMRFLTQQFHDEDISHFSWIVMTI